MAIYLHGFVQICLCQTANITLLLQVVQISKLHQFFIPSLCTIAFSTFTTLIFCLIVSADEAPLFCEGEGRIECPTNPCAEECLSDSVDVGCFVNDCESRIVSGNLLITTDDCIPIYYDLATGNFPLSECYPEGEVPEFCKLNLFSSLQFYFKLIILVTVFSCLFTSKLTYLLRIK